MSIDRLLFRQVMGQLATGVTAITTLTPEGYHGFTANAFCRVSDEPPLVLVCVDRLARGRDHLLASRVFAVSILSYRQQFLADRLAGRAPGLSRRFEGVPFDLAATGAPILRGCLAWLECEVEADFEAGDHTVFVGRVVGHSAAADGEPLVFFRGAFAKLSSPEF